MTVVQPAVAGVSALLVAAMSAQAGQPAPSTASLYVKCTSCHALETGANLPSGPSLAGVVNGPVAAQSGFDYSPALRRFAAANPCWTPELLDRFIADPEGMVPGTYMGFHGIGDRAERAALIAWLQDR